MSLYTVPDLYDEQYAHYRDDLAFYTVLAADYGSPVLELGCGTGRVALALAGAGHDVVGVELSGAMLARAEQRLGEAGAAVAKRVSLHQADMRTLQLDRRFPLIIAPFNTLMHLYTLPDQDAALAAVKRHLDVGAAFALDLYTPNFSNLDRLRRETEWAHVGGKRGELFIYQTHDLDAQLLESRYYLDTVAENGALTRQTTVLKQRYYTRFELERALLQAGFTQVQVYGGFDKRRYSHGAPNLVVVARL